MERGALRVDGAALGAIDGDELGELLGLKDGAALGAGRRKRERLALEWSDEIPIPLAIHTMGSTTLSERRSSCLKSAASSHTAPSLYARLPPEGVQGWRACSHAQPGCPTQGAPPAAARQLHLLRL